MNEDRLTESLDRFDAARRYEKSYFDLVRFVMEGFGGGARFDADLLAAAYAFNAAKQAGYGYTDADIEAHLDTLVEYGAAFDYDAAKEIARAYVDRGGELEEMEEVTPIPAAGDLRRTLEERGLASMRLKRDPSFIVICGADEVIETRDGKRFVDTATFPADRIDGLGENCLLSPSVSEDDIEAIRRSFGSGEEKKAE